jgi:zinc transporter, ZIP family
MSVWAALGWGGFSSAALYIGEWLAGPMRNAHRATGEVMGFGAGTMISAVGYELIPESSLSHGLGIGIGFLLGAFVYFLADKVIDQRGGAERQAIAPVSTDSSGAEMFLGALLDGIPKAFVLGVTLATGGVGKRCLRDRRVRVEHPPRASPGPTA